MSHNCGGDYFDDTTLRLNCIAFDVNSASPVGDLCSKEVYPHDACMLFLGLGPKLCLDGHNHSFATDSMSENQVSKFKHNLSDIVDSETLQLGLSLETGGHANNTEKIDLCLANHFQSVIDEGSTTGGSFMPHLLQPSSNESILYDHGKGKPDNSMDLQDCREHSSDPSANTDCSEESFKDHLDEHIVHHSHTRSHHPKKCMFEGCSKGARGASGLCIAHGGGQRCQKPGCNKGAESRTAFCKTHGGGRRCETLGCTKSAEGKSDLCIGHGGGLRCVYMGCTKAARGRSGLCIRHGGGKRCSKEGCTRSAEGQAGLCISHGGGRRCQHLGCTKGAQGSTMHCKAHGGGRRCIVEGCTKGAEGSTPLCKGHGGGKRCLHEGGGVCTKSVHGGTDYCVAHGGGKRCVVPGCTKSARGRTDCCVKHGGGKRCKHNGCGKSAQGSTDFCKAHGGGRKCNWEEGCEKFSRGRSGLCTAHANKVAVPLQDHQTWNMHVTQFSGFPSNGTFNDHSSSVSASSESRGQISLQTHSQVLVAHSPFSLDACGEKFSGEHRSGNDGFAIPEGRVHGGGLLSLLGGDFHTANFVDDGLV